jgi:hypothetical protein
MRNTCSVFRYPQSLIQLRFTDYVLRFTLYEILPFQQKTARPGIQSGGGGCQFIEVGDSGSAVRQTDCPGSGCGGLNHRVLFHGGDSNRGVRPCQIFFIMTCLLK